uniref:Uncharacterized protein n=1 Tax=Lotharella oceanica TaxID=641309 RepID=A0A7S2XCI4_9EUKA
MKKQFSFASVNSENPEELKNSKNVQPRPRGDHPAADEDDGNWTECYSSVDRKTGYADQPKQQADSRVESDCLQGTTGTANPIVDEDASEFWLKNFKKRTVVTNLEFLEAMELSFPLEEDAVLQIICQYVVCHIGDPKSKRSSPCGNVVGDEGAYGLVTVADFNRLAQRFRPFCKCIANASKALTENVNGKYSLVQWYHGYVRDWTSILKNNPDRFLVREPRKKGAHHLLAVEYSKVFRRNGKELLGMNTKYLTIHRCSPTNHRFFLGFIRHILVVIGLNVGRSINSICMVA